MNIFLNNSTENNILLRTSNVKMHSLNFQTLTTGKEKEIQHLQQELKKTKDIKELEIKQMEMKMVC